MNRKPVSTRCISTPKASATASAIAPDTIDLTAAPFDGSVPRSLRPDRTWYRRSAPIWFPVSVCQQPSERFTAIPRRSASGSVARMTVAPVFSASFSPSRNAFGSSGFGAFSVGKSPLGSACSGTRSTRVIPTRLSSCFTGTAPVPLRGV